LVSNLTLLTKVVELDFRSTTKLVWLFLDFSTISYGFYKLADLNWRGVLIFYRKAPGNIQILAIGSLAKLHRKADRCRSNSGEGAHRRRGTSEGKCLGAHDRHGGGRCRGREGLWQRIDGE
jgi:hypothetical protein